MPWSSVSEPPLRTMFFASSGQRNARREARRKARFSGGATFAASRARSSARSAFVIPPAVRAALRLGVGRFRFTALGPARFFSFGFHIDLSGQLGELPIRLLFFFQSLLEQLGRLFFP